MTEVEWVENRPPRRWMPRIDVAELWAFRELVSILAIRDLKLRYRQTVLGALWALIQPLAAAAIFTLVFDRLANVPSDGIPYAVFVYAGMLVWTYFSASVLAAADSLVAQRSLVEKVYFPRILAPVAAVIPGLVDMAIAAVLLVGFMVVYEVAPTAALLTTPVWVVALVLFALAVGLWLAALNAQYRDARHALGFLLQVWLFASPVVFPSSLVESGWRVLYAMNPMVGLINGFRWALVGGRAPGLELVSSAAVGLLLLGSGIIYFSRVQRQIADII